MTRINPVSIVFTVALVGAVYAGVKFVPVYLLNSEVDTVLTAAKHDAAQIDETTTDTQRDRLLADVRERLLEVGVDGDTLEVYLEDDFSRLYAEYVAVVEHPFGQRTTFELQRSVEIPRD